MHKTQHTGKTKKNFVRMRCCSAKSQQKCVWKFVAIIVAASAGGAGRTRLTPPRGGLGGGGRGRQGFVGFRVAVRLMPLKRADAGDDDQVKSRLEGSPAAKMSGGGGLVRLTLNVGCILRRTLYGGREGGMGGFVLVIRRRRRLCRRRRRFRPVVGTKNLFFTFPGKACILGGQIYTVSHSDCVSGF